MNAWRFIISAVAMLVLLAPVRGDDSPERPERSFEQRDGDRPPVRPEMRGQWRSQRPQVEPESMDQFWDDARERMAELTPNHMAWFEQVPPEFQGRLRSRIISRYLELQALQGDAVLYEMVAQQLRLQDKVVGMVMTARREGIDVDREALRPLVRELEELKLAEREHRVNTLADSLAKEQARLEQDLARREDPELLDRQVDRWANMMSGRRGGPGRYGPGREGWEGRERRPPRDGRDD